MLNLIHDEHAVLGQDAEKDGFPHVLGQRFQVRTGDQAWGKQVSSTQAESGHGRP